ncbi:hypothetical protein GLYMA_13G139150v4 [Glycine max]|nr:hypothetical protein GLYMA_13G139150v4 [Glycine max]KAH1101433.1 hypothetical protein GYH30_036143 [Glycine max]
MGSFSLVFMWIALSACETLNIKIHNGVAIAWNYWSLHHSIP